MQVAIEVIQETEKQFFLYKGIKFDTLFADFYTEVVCDAYPKTDYLLVTSKDNQVHRFLLYEVGTHFTTMMFINENEIEENKIDQVRELKAEQFQVGDKLVCEFNRDPQIEQLIKDKYAERLKQKLMAYLSHDERLTRDNEFEQQVYAVIEAMSSPVFIF